jgi:hypothetical protein
MGFDDLLLIKGITWILEEIDNIDIAVIKGLLKILFLLGCLWFVGYYLLYGATPWGGFHWVRTLVIFGAWLFVELCNLVGGGHT